MIILHTCNAIVSMLAACSWRKFNSFYYPDQQNTDHVVTIINSLGSILPKLPAWHWKVNILNTNS